MADNQDQNVAYCVKCREKCEMKEGARVEESEGKGGTKRRMLKGNCSVCDTKMNKFLKSEE